MAKEAKTNAMRMLDRQKVKYEAFPYECDEFIDGLHSADLIGAPYEQSFKTLVMEGKSGGYYVFVVPIEKEVDRKAAAKAVGEKAVDMIHVKDILKITVVTISPAIEVRTPIITYTRIFTLTTGIPDQRLVSIFPPTA